MKHLLWLLLAVLLTSCATARRTASVKESRTKRDSVVMKDSLVRRDSVAMRYEHSAKDSVAVKDSVVVTLDTAGNVVRLEHYRQSDRTRESSRLTASENQHTEAQRGTSQQTNQEATSRQEATSEKRQRGVPWYVWLTGGVVAGGVWGIVWYCAFGRKKSKAMEVTVKDGQTLADVAVQECGTWEAALDIALKNGVSLTDSQAAGTKLRLPDGVTENRVMKSYCKAHDVSPATERDESGVKLRIFSEEFTKAFD